MRRQRYGKPSVHGSASRDGAGRSGLQRLPGPPCQDERGSASEEVQEVGTAEGDDDQRPLRRHGTHGRSHGCGDRQLGFAGHDPDEGREDHRIDATGLLHQAVQLSSIRAGVQAHGVHRVGPGREFALEGATDERIKIVAVEDTQHGATAQGQCVTGVAYKGDGALRRYGGYGTVGRATDDLRDRREIDNSVVVQTETLLGLQHASDGHIEACLLDATGVDSVHDGLHHGGHVIGRRLHQHVGTGFEGQQRGLDVPMAFHDGAHVQRVGEDQAVESEIPAQDTLYQAAIQGGGNRVRRQGGKRDVSGHYAGDAGLDHGPERYQLDRIETRPVGGDDGQVYMGVNSRVAMSGKMLGSGQHAVILQPAHVGGGHAAHLQGVGAVAAGVDYGVQRIAVNIHDRRERDMDTGRPCFEGGDPAEFPGEVLVADGAQPHEWRETRRAPILEAVRQDYTAGEHLARAVFHVGCNQQRHSRELLQHVQLDGRLERSAHGDDDAADSRVRDPAAELPVRRRTIGQVFTANARHHELCSLLVERHPLEYLLARRTCPHQQTSDHAGRNMNIRRRSSHRQRSTGLAAVVAILAGCALASCSSPARSSIPESSAAAVLSGLDVLLRDGAAVVNGRRIGFITNHTSVDRHGASGIDLLHSDERLTLAALFSPEHAITGRAAPGERVESGRDPDTGLPIHSLYGETRKPTAAMVRDLDVLVFDIQDIGTRYYTYVWTMVLAMEAAAEHDLDFVVLDRPNPLGGKQVQGNVLDPEYRTFVGLYPVPMRHGLTPGELARMINAEYDIGARLTVIPVEGWQRSMWFDATALPWVPPSPNMPDLESATHYPGTCLFEGTNLSVGRGTDRAFQQIGAPWLDAQALVERLQRHALPGVRFEATSFTPRSPGDGMYADVTVPGVRLVVVDRASYDASRVGIALLVEIRALHGERLEFRQSHFDRLAGTDRVRLMLLADEQLDHITADWQAQVSAFAKLRTPYLLYP
jgi:uncharacterized protein YbbC (DUF1343 family)